MTQSYNEKYGKYWAIILVLMVVMAILYFAVGFLRLYYSANSGRKVYVTQTLLTAEGPVYETRECGHGGALDAVTMSKTYFYVPGGSSEESLPLGTQSYTLTFINKDTDEVTLLFQVWPDGTINANRRAIHVPLKNRDMDTQIYQAVEGLYGRSENGVQ